MSDHRFAIVFGVIGLALAAVIVVYRVPEACPTVSRDPLGILSE